MDIIDGEKVNYGTVAKVGEGKQVACLWINMYIYLHIYVYIYMNIWIKRLY
jgi:hypothetical protein